MCPSLASSIDNYANESFDFSATDDLSWHQEKVTGNVMRSCCLIYSGLQVKSRKVILNENMKVHLVSIQIEKL